MHRILVTRARVLSLLICAAAPLSRASAAAQALEETTGPATAPQTWSGRVIRPDGAPAAGAVVVTSAGGRTLAGDDGSFALTLELPDDARTVEVIATLADRSGRGALVAREQLVPGSAGASASLGILQLQTSALPAPDWRATFGGKSGSSSRTARSVIAHDDGSGPALFVGGSFGDIGGIDARHIARWDGERWSALNSGGSGAGSVEALAIHDEGSGPRLFAGGSFTTLGGAITFNVARWNGANWSHLGSGIVGTVNALGAAKVGTTTLLYAAGLFTVAGGLPAANIARWNGLSWNSLGSGTDGLVRALAEYDDGTGPALYAAGNFTSAGGVPVNRIAKWDGQSWSALGPGLPTTVNALAVFDFGSGPELCAAGHFQRAGLLAADAVARWNGATWTTLGPLAGGDSTGVELEVFDDGSGPALYCTGSLAPGSARIAKWTGSAWSPLGTDIDNVATALTGFDDGRGPALNVVGFFSRAGDATVHGAARWDGTRWGALGKGLSSQVHALLEATVGGERELYAGGRFTGADGQPLKYITRWDAAGWSELGGGTNGAVLALALYDDGRGTALYAGGEFVSAGGAPAKKIARWDGTSWSPLGGGIPGGQAWRVNAMTAFDDGSGEALYVGGRFTQVGAVAGTHEIARWDGASWSELAGGVNGEVIALAVFDGGNGTELYVGGSFTTAGGVASPGIARWNGSRWTPLGLGVGDFGADVNAFAVHDAGQGPRLFVAGNFARAGNLAVQNLAAWDGTSWSAVAGSGFDAPLLALAVHDDGGGPTLYAGGTFRFIDNVARSHVARWNGTGWSPLGEGVAGTVRVLAGTARGLQVGGDLSTTPAGDSYLANWGAPRKVMKQR